MIIENEIKKWGNSMAIIVPNDAVKKLRIVEGEIVEVDIRLKKRINGFGIAKRAESFKEEKESHKEFWE